MQQIINRYKKILRQSYKKGPASINSTMRSSSISRHKASKVEHLTKYHVTKTNVENQEASVTVNSILKN
jgi:hypothetical protein